MIELTILNYLNQALAVPVYMETPKKTPAWYVVMEKTGSSANDGLRTAMFTFKSYAPSLLQTASLNDNVKKAMDAAADNLTEVSKSKLNSDYNYTNTTTKTYRYQAVYDVWHY